MCCIHTTKKIKLPALGTHGYVKASSRDCSSSSVTLLLHPPTLALNDISLNSYSIVSIQLCMYCMYMYVSLFVINGCQAFDDGPVEGA